MREYEVTVLLKPDLDDEARAGLLGRIETLLTHGTEESDQPKAEHWGHRTLAYPIKNYTEGYYVFYLANLEPARINDIERNIFYIDDILRHLIVRKGS